MRYDMVMRWRPHRRRPGRSRMRRVRATPRRGRSCADLRFVPRSTLRRSCARGDLMNDDLVSTAVAAVHCHLSPRTLEKRRGEAGGPPYYKVGRKVLYSLSELDDWIAQGRRLSTSVPGQLMGADGDAERR